MGEYFQKFVELVLTELAFDISDKRSNKATTEHLTISLNQVFTAHKIGIIKLITFHS